MSYFPLNLRHFCHLLNLFNVNEGHCTSQISSVWSPLHCSVSPFTSWPIKKPSALRKWKTISNFCFWPRLIITLVAFIWLFYFLQCFFQVSLQTVCLRILFGTPLAFVWLFSIVWVQMFFQVSLQTACLRKLFRTLVAFVWLFSTVCSQMPSQIGCLVGWVVTLIAIKCCFAPMHYQVFSQITCFEKCKTTHRAFVWLSSTMQYQMFP